jgi:hypothetical protein
MKNRELEKKKRRRGLANFGQIEGREEKEAVSDLFVS